MPITKLKNSQTAPPTTDTKNSHDMMTSSPMNISANGTRAASIHHFIVRANDPMKIAAMATARAVTALSIHRRLGLSHNATGDVVFDSLEFDKLRPLLVWRYCSVQINYFTLFIGFLNCPCAFCSRCFDCN
ncbi:hypothetical protein Ppro_3127 [Pelobacter propionicus DSM 2379]|uniref:Uncharacterized protein n=1 Tax=Pelobacter propionicus (strain DSM 2379 / NBRC 103807 / OttBd1) TaxID=338966 RepID=A1ATQ0_PELPD|nr:hypothetical protein Ppro_3127 [Pelobacter propionicus DSM 2379]